MSEAVYENLQTKDSTGISYIFVTTPGGYRPLHWHEEIEIYYTLNGESDIIIEGRPYQLPKKQFLVIDSCQVHSFFCHDATSMYLCVHLNRKILQKFLPDLELYQIQCYPQEIQQEQFPIYLHLCNQMERLLKLYMEDADAYTLEAPGIILQIYAQILRHFSVKTADGQWSNNRMSMNRIREVITFVETHYQEPVTLQDVTDLLGIGKEYFCRFFKKNMGISFLQYVNEVRLSHVYQDLVHTELPITEVMLKNGFTNQKLFNHTFKTLYGCTPSSVRKKGA